MESIFLDLNLCRALARCCPPVLNLLVRLSKAHWQALGAASFVQEIYPHHGLWFMIPNALFPAISPVDPPWDTGIWTMVDKMVLPAVPLLPELAAIRSLEDLAQRSGQFETTVWPLKLAKIKSRAPPFSGLFMKDLFSECLWWFEPGVGVLAGLPNKRRLVARSLAQFLSEMVHLGGLSYVPRPVKPIELKSWPVWPQNPAGAMVGLCSHCGGGNYPAEPLYYCELCRGFRLCFTCCSAGHASAAVCPNAFLANRSSHRMQLVQDNSFCSQCWIKLDGAIYMCKNCFRGHLYCAECSAAHSAAELHAAISITQHFTRCFYCLTVLDNLDRWWQCNACHLESFTQEVRICDACFQGVRSGAIEHDPQHRFALSAPELATGDCRECGLRLIHSQPLVHPNQAAYCHGCYREHTADEYEVEDIGISDDDSSSSSEEHSDSSDSTWEPMELNEEN